ncbi:MAG: patatin-like phospholipase family protein [Nitrososphaeraceae archaeon]
MKIHIDKNLKYNDNKSETVLVLQGGGSLGAYECGVFKTLNNHNIKFDILAGSSIGAVNALSFVALKMITKMLLQF